MAKKSFRVECHVDDAVLLEFLRLVKSKAILWRVAACRDEDEDDC